MQSHDLHGTWPLKSFQAIGADGTVHKLGGDSPQGFLTYTPSGYMSAVSSRSGRSKFASGDAGGGTPEEIKEAFEGFEAYAGTYEFDEASSTATHHVKVARFPNWEGSAQTRHLSLVGGELTIKPDPIFYLGQTWEVTLVWSRAPEIAR